MVREGSVRDKIVYVGGSVRGMLGNGGDQGGIGLCTEGVSTKIESICNEMHELFIYCITG